MKKKLVLHSIGNAGNFSYYIFDKKQEVIERLSKILLGTLRIEIDLYREYNDKKSNWRRRKINFEKIKDEHSEIQGRNVNIRADLFFGGKKIFLTLVYSNKNRLKFNTKLFEFFNMPKPKPKRK